MIFLVFVFMILTVIIGVKLSHSDNEFVNFLFSLFSLLLLVIKEILEYKTNVFENIKKYKKLVYVLIVVVT